METILKKVLTETLYKIRNDYIDYSLARPNIQLEDLEKLNQIIYSYIDQIYLVKKEWYKMKKVINE